MAICSRWGEIVLKTLLGIAIFSLLALYGIDSPSLAPLPSLLSPSTTTTRPPKTIHHTWSISRSSLRPDGVLKNIYTVNNAFPGPLIEARPGDTLSIRVINALEDEGTAIHWHGLRMFHQNAMDGAVGFTQDPIPPQGEKVYEFTLDDHQCGTFWWHAHEALQRAEGLYGGLIIHCPDDSAGDGSYLGGDDEVKDIRRAAGDSGVAKRAQPGTRAAAGWRRSLEQCLDIFRRSGKDEEVEKLVEADHLLLVGDWYHQPAEKTLEWYTRPAAAVNEPVPDSLLVNGVGAFNCSKAVKARPVECSQQPTPTALTVDTSKKTRLRLVNTGSLAGFSFSIRGAKLIATHIDGGNEIQPQTAREIGILYPGERVDVIVDWDGCTSEPASLDIALDGENFRYRNPTLTANQSFPLTISNPPPVCPPDTSPTTEPSVPTTFNLQDALSVHTLSALAPTDTAPPHHLASPLLLYANTMQLVHLGNTPLGFLNQTTWKPQSPPLAATPRENWDEAQLVPSVEQGSWVDIVLNNLDDGGHPFHLHGHDFWVLRSWKADLGWGSLNPWEESEDGDGVGDGDGDGDGWEWERPRRKDTVYVPSRGHVVLRVWWDNPGVWMLHCHVLWHQVTGMVAGVEVRSEG